MNYILSSLLFFFLISDSSCSSSEDKKSGESVSQEKISVLKKYPVIQFEQTEHDFGKIKRGVPVSYIFKFKNIGNAPLVIADARSSCGCTVPEKPEKPILPGETGEIKVNYNASGSGKISKTITLVTNTEKGRETLRIEALVEGK